MKGSTYTESIYVECLFGYDVAMKYIEAMKNNVVNGGPIIGKYDVNNEGSADMYNKSAIFLNTLRSQVDNDALWWSIISGIQKDFGKQTVTTAQIENYISRKAGKDFSKLFDQYLRNAALPVLEYKIVPKAEGIELTYRWVANVAGFNMPIKYINQLGKALWLNPTTEWQTITLNGTDEKSFKLDTTHFYFTEKQVKS